MGGISKLVEITHGGFVTKGATPSSLHTFIQCSVVQREILSYVGV